MELTLVRQAGMQILVICDNKPSHTFNLHTLVQERGLLQQTLMDPVAYGQCIYRALFPAGTLAQRTLAALPSRILLVATDNELDRVPWEYAFGVHGFLVLTCPFVRGLLADQRIDPPVLTNRLHVVAVPSNPLDNQVLPLNVDAEWIRLKEVIQEVPSAFTLERCRPPTLEQMRRLVADVPNCIVHFMGHGDQTESGAILLFENEFGGLHSVTANDFIYRLQSKVLLVTLNACVSAQSGPTAFSNLAASLVQQKTPYALGMRYRITDEDARTFSRVFYSEIARGSSIEKAVFQARLKLAESQRNWVVGVPVLYTALKAPIAGFPHVEGLPIVLEHRPSIEVSTLPRIEGDFQGYIDELKALGKWMTDRKRSPLLTVHGEGGQGKTTLVREAVERFSYAWPGGIWAATLNDLSSREEFVSDLAHFLGIATHRDTDSNELERRVADRLAHLPALIVLDNAETLVEAIQASSEPALRLSQFLRELLAQPFMGLLVTSRVLLGWKDEIGIDLKGLEPEEGARLLRQNMPHCFQEIDWIDAVELSRKVHGHPLSLRLLGGAFDASAISWQSFVEDYEIQLFQAENKYKEADNRHRTLNATIETSLHYLEAELRALLSGLWVFHTFFLPETAAIIFDQSANDAEDGHISFYHRLDMMWQHGLLTRKVVFNGGRRAVLYRLLSPVRYYAERYLEQAYEREVVLRRFGAAYAELVDSLYQLLDHDASAIHIAQQSREDIERSISYVTGMEQCSYLLHWARILQRLGNNRQGLRLAEQALEIAQGQDRQQEKQALQIIAEIYLFLGQPERTLALYEQILSIGRETGEQSEDTALLSNMAMTYAAMRQPFQVLDLFEKVLPIARESGNRVSEASILSSMAIAYQTTGRLQQSLLLFEQALPLVQEAGNLRNEAGIFNNIAQVYRDMRQPQRAIQNFERALPLVQILGERSLEAIILNNMAQIYTTIKQPEEALALLEQALLIQHELGEGAGEGRTLIEIARAHQKMGQPQKALVLFEQALLIQHQLGLQEEQPFILLRIAKLYREMGQPQKVLILFEQALLIQRQLANRVDEADTLVELAEGHQEMGQSQKALALLEQALLIQRQLDLQEEQPFILLRIAKLYREMGQPQKALVLFEQALQIMRRLDDREQEVVAIVSIAPLYLEIGQPQKALELFEQALSTARELGHRSLEFVILSHMATVCVSLGDIRRALTLYEHALPLCREEGDRRSEAATFSRIADIYQRMGDTERALALFEQVLSITLETGDRFNEAITLINIGLMLYQYFNRSQEAIRRLEQAFNILAEANFSQKDLGHSIEEIKEYLAAMQRGDSLGEVADELTMTDTGIHRVILGTVAVMTVSQDKQAEWRREMLENLQQMQRMGAKRQDEQDFFTAVLAILDGRPITLAAEHTFASKVAAIQAGIRMQGVRTSNTSEEVPNEILQAVQDFVNAEDWEAKRQVVEAQRELLFRPEVETLLERDIVWAKTNRHQREFQLLEHCLIVLRACKANGISETFEQSTLVQEDVLGPDSKLISGSIKALLGDPKKKLEHAQYLAKQAAQTSDEGLKALINVILEALYGGDLTQIGLNLNSVYRQAWKSIVVGVGTGGLDARIFDFIISSTLTALDQGNDQRDRWREMFIQTKRDIADKFQPLESEKTEKWQTSLSALIDAVIGLLDSNGDYESLDVNLTGIYARTWQEIIEHVRH